MIHYCCYFLCCLQPAELTTPPVLDAEVEGASADDYGCNGEATTKKYGDYGDHNEYDYVGSEVRLWCAWRGREVREDEKLV